MDALQAALLIGSALIGSGLVLLFNFEHKRITRLLVAFSGAFLLSLIFLHLLPEVFLADLPWAAGTYVLFGFGIQLFLEYLSGGVEHGHDHSHEHEEEKTGFPLVIFIGLSIHAFLEGMPIGHLGHEHNHSLLVGILLHKLPVALVLTILLKNAGLTKAKVFFWVALFALMSPLGSWAFGALDAMGLVPTGQLIGAATGLLVGILLHVSTTILFESSESHKFNGAKLIALIIGLALGAIV